MDLHVTVPSVDFDALRRKEQPEPSSVVKARVDAARRRQRERYGAEGPLCNAQLPPALVGKYCALDEAGEKLLRSAFQRMGLTARSHDRILRVARTIADLEGEERISAAIWRRPTQYRNTDILKG